MIWDTGSALENVFVWALGTIDCNWDNKFDEDVKGDCCCCWAFWGIVWGLLLRGSLLGSYICVFHVIILNISILIVYIYLVTLLIKFGFTWIAELLVLVGVLLWLWEGEWTGLLREEEEGGKWGYLEVGVFSRI